jgi:glycosyltransferase involved in cell wall biosynthesis
MGERRGNMTIVHIITRLILGGAQQNTVSSCASQQADGHQVTLIFGPIYGPEGSLLDEARQGGARLLEVRSLRRAILPPHDLFCYRRLRRLLRAIRPDVVHTHSSKAGILGRAAAWAENVPAVIHTVHGLPFHQRQPRFVYHAYVAMERWAARRCHKILGVTQAMLDTFHDHGIGESAQYEMVPSGVEVGVFSPAPEARTRVRGELGIPADAPVIGLLGRLDPLKGQDDLLDIFPDLLRVHPELRLLFVGGGWHRQKLEARLAGMPWRDRVLFTGLVPPSQVPGYLAAMDIDTLPSYQEGQPRTLVQALLCGRPIVGYDAGGIAEICLDGVTGRLVPVGDRAALRDALSHLISDPSERSRLAEAGRRHALERFDLRLMIRRLDAIYRQTMRERQNPR